MKIRFLVTLATEGETYRRGRVYELADQRATQFVREGVAVADEAVARSVKADTGDKAKADEVLTPVEHRVEPTAEKAVEKPKPKALPKKGAK